MDITFNGRSGVYGRSPFTREVTAEATPARVVSAHTVVVRSTSSVSTTVAGSSLGAPAREPTSGPPSEDLFDSE